MQTELERLRARIQLLETELAYLKLAQETHVKPVELTEEMRQVIHKVDTGCNFEVLTSKRGIDPLAIAVMVGYNLLTISEGAWVKVTPSGREAYRHKGLQLPPQDFTTRIMAEDAKRRAETTNYYRAKDTSPWDYF